MKDIFYDINDFIWSKADNSFYADAPHLNALGDYYEYAFPNGKSKFYIKNFNTNDFRRFEFEKETIESIQIDGGYEIDEIVWHFKSEDGILCKIALP